MTFLNQKENNTQENFKTENVFCLEKTNIGINYGPYHFPSSIGVVQAFVSWLCSIKHPYGKMLAKAPARTREFSCCWKYLTKEDSSEFISLQHEFVRTNYFIPTLELLECELSLNIFEICEELQYIIWTLSVKFGPQNTQKLFKMLQTDVGEFKIAKIDEHTIISFIEKITSSNSWQNIEEQLSSGLSIPKNNVSFIYKTYYKQASA